MWTAWRLLMLVLGLLLVNIQLLIQSDKLSEMRGAQAPIHDGEIGEWMAVTLQRSAPALAFLGVLALILTAGMREPGRARFMAILGFTETPAAPAEDAFGRWWNVAGWAALVAGFVGLEWLEPYYFTQDDVLIGELPGVLLGCRSLWDGVFPEWNPYVLLGAPFACLGFTSLTYPPQLLAYAIARHLLRDEFATMEVFAALHLIVGFVAMRHLSGRIGMGAMTANLAALSFVFAGCILIMGRSWHAFVPNAVWLPLVGIAIQRFREGPVGWSWLLGVGLVLGLSYHAGFPQITAILGIFLVLGLASVAIAERISLKRVAVAVPAVLLGVGLAAPLLINQLQFTSELERAPPIENGVYEYLDGAVLPYPLAASGFPMPWGSEHTEKLGHFFFFGGILAALFALQAAAFWILFPERAAWSRSWWMPCGIVALWLVLGEPGYLWKGAAAMPMSKLYLRYSFRFYPWLAFCAILSGGLVLDRILALRRQRWRWELLIGSAMLCVLAYHLAMCRASFYSYGFRPYPVLPTAFEAAFHPYDDASFVGVKNSRRVASWMPLRSAAPDYYAALPPNLQCGYRVPSIFGYDPVVEGQRRVMEMQGRLEQDPLATCKAYGVGWHLFSYSGTPANSPRAHWTGNDVPCAPAYRVLVKEKLTTLAEHGDTTLKELPGVDPLAFVTGKPERPLPMHLHCGGADIDVSGVPAGESITINFLWYPQMNVYLDGASAPVEKDDWLRITTPLPRSGTTLLLRYEPPWQRSLAIGGAVCLAALLLAWGTIRINR